MFQFNLTLLPSNSVSYSFTAMNMSVSPHHIPSQLWTIEHVCQSSSSSSLLRICLSVLIIFLHSLKLSVSLHHIPSQLWTCLTVLIIFSTARNMSVSPQFLLHSQGSVCQFFTVGLSVHLHFVIFNSLLSLSCFPGRSKNGISSGSLLSQIYSFSTLSIFAELNTPSPLPLQQWRGEWRGRRFDIFSWLYLDLFQ